MKRLFLVSMFQNVSTLLLTVEPELKGKTVTFIPTASKTERFGFFVGIGKWSLKRLGLRVDVLDVSTSPYETIKAKLEKNNYIYVTGGNTFYLLQELRKTGADALLIYEINKGKLYIGESAGAIVVAKNIEYSSAMDNKEKAPGLKDYTGLNLVNFYVVPHYMNWEFNKAVKKIVDAYSDELNLTVISDSQAIFVENDKLTLL